MFHPPVFSKLPLALRRLSPLKNMCGVTVISSKQFWLIPDPHISPISIFLKLVTPVDVDTKVPSIYISNFVPEE
jgi:hypothetical protein